MPLKPALRVTKLLAGACWAQALLVAGYAVLFQNLDRPPYLPSAVALIAAGSFVAMWLVIDDLVRHAVGAVVFGMKLLAALFFWAGAGLVVYSLITGSPIDPTRWIHV